MCHILRNYVIIFHHKRISQFSYRKYLPFPGCRYLVQDLLTEAGLSVTSALCILRPKLALVPRYCKHNFWRGPPVQFTSEAHIASLNILSQATHHY